MRSGSPGGAKGENASNELMSSSGATAHTRENAVATRGSGSTRARHMSGVCAPGQRMPYGLSDTRLLGEWRSLL